MRLSDELHSELVEISMAGSGHAMQELKGSPVPVDETQEKQDLLEVCSSQASATSCKSIAIELQAGDAKYPQLLY